MAVAVVSRVVTGKSHHIGQLSITRLLPTRAQRSVGPFVFVDHMAPPRGAKIPIDVPPHPHIGIATVTYLFEGTILHRDSLGSSCLIEPGAVNWMTAGRGIVHSERTPPELRSNPPSLFGVQCWVALPRETEDQEPHFEHYDAGELPESETAGVRVRLIAGELSGAGSPVRTASPLLCAAIEMEARSDFFLEGSDEERALIVLSGGAEVGDVVLTPGQMAVLEPSADATVRAHENCRAFLIGGPALPEPRQMDWNFVATDKARIERAKQLYRKRELGVIPGESEQLLLPEDVR